MNNEEQKYENVIKEYSYEQLVYEMSIVNKQYKKYYSMKKALEDECDRRIKED